jgi:hypothetical protein
MTRIVIDWDGLARRRTWDAQPCRGVAEQNQRLRWGRVRVLAVVLGLVAAMTVVGFSLPRGFW